MNWYSSSCERPSKRSASEALPLSVSNRYSLSIRTRGSSCRRRASSSLRRVSSFSSLSSPSRAASHSSRVPVLCFVIVLVSFLRVSLRLFQNRAIQPYQQWTYELQFLLTRMSLRRPCQSQKAGLFLEVRPQFCHYLMLLIRQPFHVLLRALHLVPSKRFPRYCR